MVAILQDSCRIDSIELKRTPTMTTTEYLFSKGYSATEVETIMREIMELDGTTAFSDPVVAEWVAADPYAVDGEELVDVWELMDVPF
jgi:hypothetical protein